MRENNFSSFVVQCCSLMLSSLVINGSRPPFLNPMTGTPALSDSRAVSQNVSMMREGMRQ